MCCWGFGSLQPGGDHLHNLVWCFSFLLCPEISCTEVLYLTEKKPLYLFIITIFMVSYPLLRLTQIILNWAVMFYMSAMLACVMFHKLECSEVYLLFISCSYVEVGNLGNVGGKDLSRTLYLITRTTLFIRGRRVGNKWEKDGALWSGPSIPSHGSNEREEPHGAKSAIYLRCRLSSCSCRRRLMHSSHQFETLTRISSPSSPVCRRRRRDRGDGSRGGRRGRRLPSLKNVSVVVSRSQSTSFSLYAAAKNPRSFCLKRLDHDTYSYP
ncbi:unnamed protein product [Musa textilis]